MSGQGMARYCCTFLVLAFVGLFSVSFLQGMVGYFVEIRVALEDRDILTCEVAWWGVYDQQPLY